MFLLFFGFYQLLSFCDEPPHFATIGADAAVHLAAIGDTAALLDLPCCHALMHVRRKALIPTSLIASVVDFFLLREAFVADFRPRSTPLLDEFLLVPVPIFFLGKSVNRQRSVGQHDVHVWVSVAIVVDGIIGDHTHPREGLTVFRDRSFLFLLSELARQGKDDFAGKASVLSFARLHLVPERPPICKTRGRILREKNLRIDYTAFAGVVMQYAIVVVADCFAASVSGGGDGRSTFATGNDIDLGIVDCHIAVLLSFPLGERNTN